MLAGNNIWITRPAGQADNLTEVLHAKGAQLIKRPMLAIEPIALNETIKALVLNLDQYDLIFFISTNAASLGMELIQNYWPQFPSELTIYAVGPTTADVIKRYDLKAEFPRQRMSTEALLALPSLINVDGKRALIVRGAGGRELLASALRERGVLVDYLELYQRTCPPYSQGELQKCFAEESPQAIVISSAEALNNFYELLVNDEILAESVPLFVSSERIAEIAREKGFSQTITMSGADDKAIIQSLENHLSGKEN